MECYVLQLKRTKINQSGSKSFSKYLIVDPDLDALSAGVAPQMMLANDHTTGNPEHTPLFCDITTAREVS